MYRFWIKVHLDEVQVLILITSEVIQNWSDLYNLFQGLGFHTRLEIKIEQKERKRKCFQLERYSIEKL